MPGSEAPKFFNPTSTTREEATTVLLPRLGNDAVNPLTSFNDRTSEGIIPTCAKRAKLVLQRKFFH